MSIFKFYTIKDHKGNTHLVTDKYLWKLVLKQSKKSNYDWIAPVNELYEVCNEGDFNENYAKDIKVAIINCYAELFSIFKNDKEMSYVYKIYNELYKYKEDEIVKNARKKFLVSYINNCLYFHKFMLYTYRNLYQEENKWINQVVDKKLEDKYVEFNLIHDPLKKEFEEYIDGCISSGTIIKEESKPLLTEETIECINNSIYHHLQYSDEAQTKECNSKVKVIESKSNKKC